MCGAPVRWGWTGAAAPRLSAAGADADSTPDPPPAGPHLETQTGGERQTVSTQTCRRTGRETGS